LKERLHREIGPEYAALLAMLKEVRAEITQRVTDFETRRALWYRIADSELLEMLRNDHASEAQHCLRQMIEDAANSTSHSDISGDDDDQ
jgi:siroheme synthase (precorrin-2 oxidase/ferrochelatase)